MGRLEKQIIAGALGLVGILLSIVVFKGLQPREIAEADTFVPGPTDYPDLVVAAPALLVQTPVAPIVLADASVSEVFVEKNIQPPLNVETSLAEMTEVFAGVLDLGAADEWDPEVTTYTVKPGDTLTEIAQAKFGTWRATTEILKLNEGLSMKSTLQVGQVISLPHPSMLPWNRKASEVVGEAIANRRTHKVKAGDSLWKISKVYFDDGSKTDRIVKANPKLLKDSNQVLRIGMVLVIPE
jgi:LysM repeat protein